MAKLIDIDKFIDSYLRVSDFKTEKLVNGVNVQGKEDVTKIAVGMCPNMELFEKAAEWGADAIITHHPLLEDQLEKYRTQGVMKKREDFLLQKNISLLSYHLPLDLHEEVGNNVMIVKKLGAKLVERFGEYGDFKDIFFVGEFSEPKDREKLIIEIRDLFEQEPQTVLAGSKSIKRIAVVSGGGGSPDFFLQLSPEKIDMYLTGEIKEGIPSMAKEIGLNFISAGHYATEIFGVQALAKKLEKEFDITTKFIPVKVPY